MKILWISLQYPNMQNPVKGIFIKRTLDYLNSKLLQYQFHILVPYSSNNSLKPDNNYNNHLENNTDIWDNKISESNSTYAKVFFMKYFRLPKKYFKHIEGYFFWLINKKKILKNFDYKLIHANWLTPEGHIAYLLSKKTGVPYVITMRGTDVYDCKDRKNMLRISQKVIDNALLVTGNSYFIFEIAKKNGLNLDNKHCYVTHSFYEIGKFIIKDKSLMKKKLGFSLDRKIVFFAGALRKVKNIDSLINAISLFSTETIQLIIAGEGPEINNLTNLVQKNNLTSIVSFVGSLNTLQIIDFFNAADVFCLPSHNEGFGNVIIESLLCGTPVVASRVGEIPKHLKDGVNGYLFNPNNINEIAQAIHKALEQEWNRESLRESIMFLDPENVIKEYENIYKQVLKPEL